MSDPKEKPQQQPSKEPSKEPRKAPVPPPITDRNSTRSLEFGEAPNPDHITIITPNQNQ